MCFSRGVNTFWTHSKLFETFMRRPLPFVQLKLVWPPPPALTDYYYEHPWYTFIIGRLIIGHGPTVSSNIIVSTVMNFNPLFPRKSEIATRSYRGVASLPLWWGRAIIFSSYKIGVRFWKWQEMKDFLKFEEDFWNVWIQRQFCEFLGNCVNF